MALFTDPKGNSIYVRWELLPKEKQPSRMYGIKLLFDFLEEQETMQVETSYSRHEGLQSNSSPVPVAVVSNKSSSKKIPDVHKFTAFLAHGELDEKSLVG